VTFPAYYDKCWQGAIRPRLGAWSEVEIVPYFAGLGYFDSVAALRAAYLAWEEWVMAHEWNNLAPYYVVDAAR
jgi:hypothetical protein